MQSNVDDGIKPKGEVPPASEDKPHADSGGHRTPSGGTYGDFVPDRPHDGKREPYDDESPGPGKPGHPAEPPALQR